MSLTLRPAGVPSGDWSLGAVSVESITNNDYKKLQRKLIRLYIAVLVCVLLISVYSVCLLSHFEPCGTKPNHAHPSHCLSEW